MTDGQLFLKCDLAEGEQKIRSNNKSLWNTVTLLIGWRYNTSITCIVQIRV